MYHQEAEAGCNETFTERNSKSNDGAHCCYVATDDDPHGPQGTRVLAENEEDYKQRDDDMKEAKVKTWGKCITGYSGAARRTADRAHHEKPFDPVYMLDCIDKEFGVQTEKTTANRKCCREVYRNGKDGQHEDRGFQPRVERRS